MPLFSQNIFRRVDSILTKNYYKGNIDTTYVTRPSLKWTLKAQFNLSGAKIESEGIENGRHFKSAFTAEYKSTISLGVSYAASLLLIALVENVRNKNGNL